MGVKSREAPEPLAWGLAFLRPPERVPEVPVISRENLPQLEKFQEVLPSRRDEPHFRRGDSRLITPNLWTFQRALHTLAATQEVPRHTRFHSKGSMRVPPTTRRAPFQPHSSRGGILSLRGRGRISGVPVASQEEALSTGKARGTQGHASIHRAPRCLSRFQGNLFSPQCLNFQAEDRLRPRWHVGQPCEKPSGKASWESLQRKPQIPGSTQREA